MISIRKKLILDMDGCIINSIKAIVDLYNQDYKFYKDFKPILWTDISSWCFTECTLTSREHVDDYFNNPRFFEVVEFMENAKEVITELSNTYEIIVCSKGDYPNLKQKELWIKKNMPYVSEFIGVDINQYKDKSHIDMSGAIFIDDETKNLVSSSSEEKILYGDFYPWNSDYDGVRCYNWTEVMNCLR